jgi:hypothetical protein
MADADVIPRDVAVLKKLKKGDEIKVEAKGLKKPRILTVTEVDSSPGGISVYVSSGAVRPSSVGGGMVIYSPKSYGNSVMYQPTMLQQIVPVTRLNKV